AAYSSGDGDPRTERRAGGGPGSVRALVTGAGGFVGHHLVAHLREAGDDVVVTDHAVDGLDVTDAAALLAHLRSTRPEVIYHLAGASDVGGSWQTPLETF